MTWLRGSWVFLLGAVISSGCGDSTAGTGASASGTTTTMGSPTSTGAGTTADGPTTGEPSPTGSASEGGSTSTSTTATSTTGAPDPTTGAPLTSGTSSTTGDDTTGAPETSSTSGDGTTTTGGVSEPPPPPMMPAGCQVCECCDPWPISWAAVPGATHYVVRWRCSINPEQVHDVGPVTSISDVCNDIEMCNGMCVFTVGYIRVSACNEDGCSAPIDIPADEIPISCGGGCCC